MESSISTVSSSGDTEVLRRNAGKGVRVVGAAVVVVVVVVTGIGSVTGTSVDSSSKSSFSSIVVGLFTGFWRLIIEYLKGYGDERLSNLIGYL